MASRVYRPCFRAFLLPHGGLDPGAPARYSLYRGRRRGLQRAALEQAAAALMQFYETKPRLLARIPVTFTDDGTYMTAANDLAVRRALELAGVEFIDENGGGPGVRPCKAQRSK
jgi:hypothetical protein